MGVSQNQLPKKSQPTVSLRSPLEAHSFSAAWHQADLRQPCCSLKRTPPQARCKFTPHTSPLPAEAKQPHLVHGHPVQKPQGSSRGGNITRPSPGSLPSSAICCLTSKADTCSTDVDSRLLCSIVLYIILYHHLRAKNPVDG